MPSSAETLEKEAGIRHNVTSACMNNCPSSSESAVSNLMYSHTCGDNVKTYQTYRYESVTCPMSAPSYCELWKYT